MIKKLYLPIVALLVLAFSSCSNTSQQILKFSKLLEVKFL